MAPTPASDHSSAACSPQLLSTPSDSILDMKFLSPCSLFGVHCSMGATTAYSPCRAMAARGICRRAGRYGSPRQSAHRAGSVGTDASRVGYLAPPVELRMQDFRHLGGRTTTGLEALLQKGIPHLFLAQDRIQFGVEPDHDVRGQARGRP